MELHPPPKRHGWIGSKKRHRSARSLATLEKRHRVQLNHFNGLDMLLRVRHPMCRKLLQMLVAYNVNERKEQKSIQKKVTSLQIVTKILKAGEYIDRNCGRHWPC